MSEIVFAEFDLSAEMPAHPYRKGGCSCGFDVSVHDRWPGPYHTAATDLLDLAACSSRVAPGKAHSRKSAGILAHCQRFHQQVGQDGAKNAFRSATPSNRRRIADANRRGGNRGQGGECFHLRGRPLKSAATVTLPAVSPVRLYRAPCVHPNRCGLSLANPYARDVFSFKRAKTSHGSGITKT